MRTALVTGGSRGIGSYAARKLGQDGFQVVLVARDERRLIEECRKIEDDGGTATYFVVDFDRKFALEELKSRLVEEKLEPCVLIHGLGGGFGSKSFDALETYERVLNLNFVTAHFLTLLVLENAKKKNWGRFIFFGTMAINHKSASAPYVAAKSALMSYAKVMAKELAVIDSNLVVASVSPGAISVPGKYLNNLEKENPEALKEYIRDTKIPAGRLGRPEEVAEVISFLCKNESRYLHGCNIEIDGGASN